MATMGAGKRNRPQLGGNVRRIRRQRGLSQAALASELGISASYLNLIEHNRRNLTVPLLIRFTELFDIELTDVADYDEGRLVAHLRVDGHSSQRTLAEQVRDGLDALASPE